MPTPVAVAPGTDLADRRSPVDVVAAGHRAPSPPDIPAVVLAAYQRAALAMETVAPGCGLTWWMLAGIGKMESDHADGGLVDAGGTTREPIRGPWLDGRPGTAAVPARSAPAGGGAAWERAEGPMQFLPATWAVYGGGGNPDNVADAALGAARYLCAGDNDLSDTAQLAAAVFRYNRSQVYVAAVLGWARAYATGTAPAPRSAAVASVASRNSSATAVAAAAAAVAYATVQLGLPYVWGGNGPEHGDVGFDCSGLTHAAYVAAGIPIPRTAQSQYDAGPRLGPGQPPIVGDLVFYGSPGRVHHVGIYVGGDRMINAPTFGQPVALARYRWPGDDYLGATRPAARPGSLPASPLVPPTSSRGPATASDSVAAVPAPARRAVAAPAPTPSTATAPATTPASTPAPRRTPSPPPAAAPTVTATPAATPAATPTQQPTPAPPPVVVSPPVTTTPVPSTRSSVRVTPAAGHGGAENRSRLPPPVTRRASTP